MNRPMTVHPDEAIYTDNSETVQTATAVTVEDTSVFDGVSFNYGSTTKLGRHRDMLKGLN